MTSRSNDKNQNTTIYVWICLANRLSILRACLSWSGAKCANRLELEKCCTRNADCKMSMYFQKSASVQPITSPPKLLTIVIVSSMLL